MKRRILNTALGLFTGIALLSGCGAEGPQNDSSLDIINGTLPSDNGLIESSTVALVNPNSQVFCSGTLISPLHIVSAAHCLDGYRQTLFIGFGRNDTEFQYIAASDFEIHPSYTGSFFKTVPADIAVIELSEPAPADYEPVTLYKGPLSGEDLYLAGFGQTEQGRGGQLFYTTVGLRSSSSNEITVFAQGTGACYGDSGGPAYVFDGRSLQVFGATSRGTAGCRGSSTYTYIPFFEAWLENWTGLNL